MFEGIWDFVINNHQALVALITGLLAITGFFIKKVVIPVFKAFEEYKQLCNNVNKVMEELTHNGGSSIKDSITRMEQEIGNLREAVDEVRFIQIKKLSERQRALLADKTDLLFETDPQGNCIWVNRTYARAVGRTPSELYGHGWQNVIAPEEREYVTKSWYKAVEENREFSLDFTIETPDGVRKPATVKSYKMNGQNGEVIGYFGQINLKRPKQKVDERT